MGHMVSLSLLLMEEVSRIIKGCRSGLFSHAANVCATDTFRFPMANSCATDTLRFPMANSYVTETCLWSEQSSGFLLLLLQFALTLTDLKY